MTLAEKLRFLADRVEDGKEFYWGDTTMRFDSESMLLENLNGEQIRSHIRMNTIKYHDVELKPHWEFTEDEKTILRNIDDIWKWIVRDENGGLCLYNTEPYKTKDFWTTSIRNYARLTCFNHLFQSIQWSDEEPCEFRRYL